MAEVVLSPFLEVLFDKLASPILREFRLLSGVDKELKRLSRTLSRIQAVLHDAEERQIRDEAVKIWLRDLKDVAYEADDVLDEFATQVQISNANGREPKTAKKVRSFFSSFLCANKVLFRTHKTHRIKEIRERLDEISTERNELHLREGVGERRVEIEDRRPQSSSLIDKSDVLGREDDKEIVIRLLVGDESSGRDAFVIPIVGMEGLGKTTLSQLVYNDERVEKHFELRIWVCVSEDFDVRKLTKAIIESATQSKYDLLDMDPMQCRLGEILNGRRFLLVLDDVWNENHGSIGMPYKVPYDLGRMEVRL